MFSYRPSTHDDLPFVVKLYNAVIAENQYTADLHPFTIEEKAAWFEEVNTPPLQLFIAMADGKDAGFFYFSFWRKGRAALDGVAEISYYIAEAYRGIGLGSFMMDACLAEAQKAGFNHLLAIMLDTNQRSKNLLLAKGFSLAGHLPKIAKMPGQTCGQAILLYSFYTENG